MQNRGGIVNTRRYHPAFVEAFRNKFYDIEYDVTPCDGVILAAKEGSWDKVDTYRSFFAAPLTNDFDLVRETINLAKRGVYGTLMLQADMLNDAVINGMKFAREIVFILQNPFIKDDPDSIGQYVLMRFAPSGRSISAPRNTHADMAWWDIDRDKVFNQFSIIRRFRDSRQNGYHPNGKHSSEMDWASDSEVEDLAEAEA
jgi:hypothetical protein